MEFFILIVGLVINGIVANIIGKIGKDKKIGYGTSFWVSFLLTPILGILMVIASQPITEKEKREKEEKIGKETKFNRSSDSKPYTGWTFGGEIGKEITNREQLAIVFTALIGLIIILFIAAK